jgi:DNA primase
MRDTYLSDPPNARPNILEVIGRYLPLRKVGREHIGNFPFHRDKNPSFRVSEEKGVFHCFGCQEGGDVIRFVEVAEGVGFKEAISILGMGNGPRPPKHSPARQAAQWVHDQIQKMNFRIRELDEQLELADEIPDPDLAESIWNERRILGDLRDDLGRFEYRSDFIQIRDVIEKITRMIEA